MGISTIKSKLKRGLALTQKESGDLWEYIRSLEKKQRWIPVSERLPKIQNYSDYYLVTLKSGVVNIAMFIECDGKHWWTSYSDVIAWKPLPQPYKVESEKEE